MEERFEFLILNQKFNDRTYLYEKWKYPYVLEG